MPEFSRLLCAIDLTDPSRRALDCALWWARQYGADVSVLHVRPLMVPGSDTSGLAADVVAPSASTVPPVDPPLAPDERQARLRQVEAFVERARTGGLQIEVLLEEDVSIPGAITSRADALAPDLIVVGAGTEPASDHPALGRTTLEVLRTAPCSVLVVPPPAADVANPCLGGLGRIMCAVKLSDGSEQVLDYAAGIAEETAAHLTIVHVVELFSEVAALAYDFDAHREARLQPACEELVALVREVVGRNKPVEEIVAQGTPGTEILKLAAEASTDLLVLGRNGSHKPAGRPTGPAVARDARCPVLFVRTVDAVLTLPFERDTEAVSPSASTGRGR